LLFKRPHDSRGCRTQSGWTMPGTTFIGREIHIAADEKAIIP
jgi:hypothetical protein